MSASGPPPTSASNLISAAKELARDLTGWAWSVIRHGIAFLGGALMTVALFASEHQRGEAYSWRAAEWILGSTLVVAFFLAWRESYRAMSKAHSELAEVQKSLASERESKLPALVGAIRMISKGRARNLSVPLFFAQMEIRNDGFRSAVKDFCPAVRLNGREFLGQLAIVAEAVNIKLPDGTVRVFYEKEAIYNVTKTPIEPGDVRSGHLHFYFNEEAGDFNKHLVRIYFRDYRDRAFATDPIDESKTLAATELPHMSGMFSIEQYRKPDAAAETDG